MKNLDFGQNMPSAGDLYLRVKEKGDQITFRIAQNPVYTAKHFMKNEDNSWNVTECPRVMNGEDCDLCIEFFKLKAQSKKIKDSDKNEAAKLDSKAREFGASIQFYFPVLNRDTEEMGILQVTQGVRNKLNEQFESGVKIFERDFVLRNTGLVGKERYSIAVVDSADSKKISEKEVANYAAAQEFDLTSISDSGNEDE